MPDEDMSDVIEILGRPSPDTVVVRCARCGGFGRLYGKPEDPPCPTCRGDRRLMLEVGE
jgi:hypothetical protein